MWLDLETRTEVQTMLVPQTVNADVTGPEVNMQNAPEEAVVIVGVGAISDGSYQVEIHHSDTSGGTFTNLLDASGNAVKSSVFSSTNDEKVEVITIRGYKQFVKAVVKETAAGITGGPISIAVQGVRKVV